MPYSFYTKKTFTYDIGEFIERPNRFIAFVKYKNKTLRCHTPDPGRLKELLKPAVTVLLRFPELKDKGKTDAAMIGVLVEKTNVWVSTDSQLASRCIREIWKELPYFKDYETIKPEYTYGDSRIDFFLERSRTNERCLIEIKSVGLKKEDNIGYFPDAPTKRGAKHVHELQKSIEDGFIAMVVFFVPREDVVSVKPNKDLDYEFYSAVKEAQKNGVKFKALRFKLTTAGILYDQEIPFSVD